MMKSDIVAKAKAIPRYIQSSAENGTRKYHGSGVLSTPGFLNKIEIPRLMNGSVKSIASSLCEVIVRSPMARSTR